MTFYCTACGREYELNRTDLSCIYCGCGTCRPYEANEKEEPAEGDLS